MARQHRINLCHFPGGEQAQMVDDSQRETLYNQLRFSGDSDIQIFEAIKRNAKLIDSSVRITSRSSKQSINQSNNYVSWFKKAMYCNRVFFILL